MDPYEPSDPFSFLKGDDHDFNSSLKGLEDMYTNMMEPGVNQRQQNEKYQKDKMMKQMIQQQNEQTGQNAVLGLPVLEASMIPQSPQQPQYVQYQQFPQYPQYQQQQQFVGYPQQPFLVQPPGLGYSGLQVKDQQPVLITPGYAYVPINGQQPNSNASQPYNYPQVPPQ